MSLDTGSTEELPTISAFVIVAFMVFGLFISIYPWGRWRKKIKASINEELKIKAARIADNAPKPAAAMPEVPVVVQKAPVYDEPPPVPDSMYTFECRLDLAYAVSDQGLFDELLVEAIEVIVTSGMASVSMLQRRLILGYSRALSLVDTMERLGIVGPHDGAHPRKILIPTDQETLTEVMDKIREKQVAHQKIEPQIPTAPAKNIPSLDKIAEMEKGFSDTYEYVVSKALTAQNSKDFFEKLVDHYKCKCTELIEEIRLEQLAEEWRPKFCFDDPMEAVDKMEGHDFEHWCAGLLKKNGFSDVVVTPGSGDQGVDITAEKDGILYAIQCKCYSSDLGNKPVQEVHAGKTLYGRHVGVVMTNRGFTAGARELAQSTGVLLWGRDKLQEMISAANTQ